MDTRRKIVPLQGAKALLEQGDWTVIVGLFDPLTVIQAQRIENHKRGRTLVIVLEGEDTLLDAEARCHLAAALRSVDFVARAAGHEWRSVVSQNDHLQVIEDLQAEKRRSEEFIERIIARQGGAAS